MCGGEQDDKDEETEALEGNDAARWEVTSEVLGTSKEELHVLK